MAEPDRVAELVHEHLFVAARREARELGWRVVGDDHALGDLPVRHAVDHPLRIRRVVGAADGERGAGVGDLAARVAVGHRQSTVEFAVRETPRRARHAVGETQRTGGAPDGGGVRELHEPAAGELRMASGLGVDVDRRGGIGLVPAGRVRSEQRVRRGVEAAACRTSRHGRFEHRARRAHPRTRERGQGLQRVGGAIVAGHGGFGIGAAHLAHRRRGDVDGAVQHPLALLEPGDRERVVARPHVEEHQHVFTGDETRLAADDERGVSHHAAQLLDDHARRRALEAPRVGHLDRDERVDGAGGGVPRGPRVDHTALHGGGARAGERVVAHADGGRCHRRQPQPHRGDHRSESKPSRHARENARQVPSAGIGETGADPRGMPAQRCKAPHESVPWRNRPDQFGAIRDP